MADLKKAFEEEGLTNVKTLLNSGNVVFESSEKESGLVRKKIEQKLAKTFGFPIPVLIRTFKDMTDLVEKNPFKKIEVTPQTRLYVTFLSEKPHINREIPYISPDKHFKILQMTDDAVFCVLIISKEFDTTKLMAMWEKELGKNITTRNWNTLVKMASL